jgi:OOP family OmpA-OmpF porin
MNIKHLMLTLALGAFSASASYAGSTGYKTGMYVGGSAGQASYDEACDGISNCDDEDTGWKLFWGEQVNQNFAVELDYVNLGEASGKVSGNEISAEAHGVTLSGIGLYPVTDQFGVFGRFGGMLYDVDVKGPSKSESNQGGTFTYGIGVQYNFFESFGVRAEWEMFKGLEADNNEDDDISLLSIGAVFWF